MSPSGDCGAGSADGLDATNSGSRRPILVRETALEGSVDLVVRPQGDQEAGVALPAEQDAEVVVHSVVSSSGCYRPIAMIRSWWTPRR